MVDFKLIKQLFRYFNSVNATAAVTIPDLFDPDDDSETDEDLVNSINGTLIANATTSDKNRTEVLASSSSPVSSRFISPLASAFLIGGAVLIVLVSAVGFWILKKEQQRRVTQNRDNLGKNSYLMQMLA